MWIQGQIRVLALGIIQQDDRLFLSEGYDPTKQSYFYRALGGGVDFGETSEVALHREFQEELNTEITNLQYLGCLENIFTFDGNSGHELIQLYRCDFVDQKFYQLTETTFLEGTRQKKALWVEIDRLRSGELRLVPEGFLDYLIS
jgi:8-oxo-dGTP pyrophosphatase MutT (NUDIX family)